MINTVQDPALETLTGFGSPTATFRLYLPNPPVLYEGFVAASPNIPRMIENNGNHWRKIFTIMAKLSSSDKDWKSYRDTGLLQKQEMICFEDKLQSANGWHLIAGKASWERMGFDAGDFSPADNQARAWIKDNVILTPYPDYRQFSNDLIAQIGLLLSGR
jgi:hypothetical protein